MADSGISLTLVCAFCFVPAGFAIFLISERAKHEDILQRICGVGRSLYWFASFIWDMVGLPTCLYTGMLTLSTFLYLLNINGDCSLCECDDFVLVQQITYEVIVGLAVLMILLFQIPSFTARDNLKAVFVTIQLFGYDHRHFIMPVYIA